MLTRSHNPGPRRLRIFLCHASEDKPVVREIYQKLKTYNVDPWLDEVDLVPGEKWEQVIPEVISRCDIVLICLSRALLVKEGYGHYEIYLILEAAKRKPPGTIFHIPFKLEECEVPTFLGDRHFAAHYVSGGFEKMVGALEKKREWLNTYQGANIEPLLKEPPVPAGSQQVESDSGKLARPESASLDTGVGAQTKTMGGGSGLPRESQRNEGTAWRHKRRQRRLILFRFLIGLVIVSSLVGIAYLIHPFRLIPAKPGGAWISPKEESVGSRVQFVAFAYPTNSGDPGIDHVNFTAYWQGVDPRQWIIVCVAKLQRQKDVFACDADLRKLGVSPGQMRVSFDVYDQQGNHANAPGGVHTLTYVPDSSSHLEVTSKYHF